MRVLFVDLTEGHNPHLSSEKPTGGTLTSLTYVPKYLASIGHEVYVRSTYGMTEDVDDVHYIKDDISIPRWEVLVLNRNVLPNNLIEESKRIGAKIIWWLHDIVDTRYLMNDNFKYVDHIVALSKYCRNTYSKFYGIKEDKFSIIPNGIDEKLFYSETYEKRDPNLYITASALIKGYIPLDLTYTNLQRHNPNLDFRIYSNQSLHGFKNTTGQTEFLDKMAAAGAHIYSPLTPTTLAKVMRQAWCLLMPNSYPEICSNLLLQARACGLPIISSNIGANPEFITHGKTGILTIDFNPHDIHSWKAEFAGLACRLYLDKELHKTIADQTSKDVPTWGNVGDAWNKLIEAI